MNSAITIGRLAAAVGVGIDTVRYYERAGLMPLPPRSPAGYRSYSRHDIRRLRFIRRAKDLGFGLAEIRRILELHDARGDRAEVRQLAKVRLADIEHKLVEMQRLRDSLAELVRACDGYGSLEECPIVEAMLSPDSVEGGSAKR